MKTAIVQWQTSVRFTLGRVGFLYSLNLPPKHTAGSFVDSAGRSDKSVLHKAQGGDNMITYGWKRHDITILTKPAFKYI